MGDFVLLHGSIGPGLFGGVLVLLLLALAYADIKDMILPDWLNATLAVTGLGQSLVLQVPDPIDAGVGALLGTCLFGLVGFGFQQLRGYPGLGLGDVKFAGAAGFWIGWQGIPIMLLSASLLALTVVVARLATQQGLDLRAQLPFGPFLCAGTFLAWLLISAPS
jgi:leader peptidase (prepilin peptidase) / N-methyltransferase